MFPKKSPAAKKHPQSSLWFPPASYIAAFVVLLLCCAGCATGYPAHIERSAVNVPEQFFVESAQGLSAPTTVGMSPARLIDPRNGAHLQLLRSVNGVGDYEAPAGSYGLGERELLRVDSYGKALGIVRR